MLRWIVLITVEKVILYLFLRVCFCLCACVRACERARACACACAYVRCMLACAPARVRCVGACRVCARAVCARQVNIRRRIYEDEGVDMREQMMDKIRQWCRPCEYHYAIIDVSTQLD